MANDANTDKWYFSKEQLENTASRKAGYDNFKELSYRQQTANFIQDMGQRLKVTQLCINTAIVYMHRFYVFHSFTNFPWHQMAAAALFLAAKVEEQPRKLEYVIRIANMCRNSRDSNIDVTSEKYIAQSQDLVFNENVLLQTLGFDVAIDHPHTHVVRCCHLVRASKDLAQSSYFLASNSLHLTTMCLQYKPTVVACFCIHLACKWSRWEIPLSTEKKEWFLYVDPTVTAELLQQLTAEFLTIFENCPSRLKEKVMTISDSALHTNTITNSPFDTEPKRTGSDPKEHHPHRTHESKTGSEGDPHKHRSRPHDSSSQQMKDREYREKKEREKLAQQHGMKPLPPPKQGPSSSSHGHHRTLVKPTQPRPPSGHPSSRAEPRDILREAAKDSAFGIATKDYKSDKDVPKQRDYLLKPNVAPAPETNSYSFNGDKPNRPPSRPPDPNKPPTMKRPSYNPNNPLKVSKSPCDVKSVPKPSSQSVKQHHHNGNTIEPPVKQEAKEEEATPAVKKPSLFSPEKSPPDVKPPPPEVKLEANDSLASFLSPLQSPANKRVRNYSTGSEPELRPVMKKIDQVEGFENLRRESSIGINKLHQVPDMITPITDKEIKKEIKKEFSPVSYAKEMKPPDIIPPLLCSEISQPLVNGIETNPMLISSLLKETPTIPHLPVVKETPVQSDHHHHKSKKKNKEKHKHKDKGKGREEKEKKKKHKDREKHKHKEEQPLQTEPIKIKIQKDKIQPPNTLKIKIPKDVIKTELPEQPPVGLKIKIPKDKINEGNRKRERDRNSTGADAPPEKLAKNSRESKQNGRHSYGKVSECSSSAPPAAVYQNLAYQPQNMYYYHQPYMYPGEGQMYNYYNNYMYPTDMYQMPGEPPPLPADAPPDRPPPPPPE